MTPDDTKPPNSWERHCRDTERRIVTGILVRWADERRMTEAELFAGYASRTTLALLVACGIAAAGGFFPWGVL